MPVPTRRVVSFYYYLLTYLLLIEPIAGRVFFFFFFFIAGEDGLDLLPPTHNREPYDTLLYCPTSCSYRSVCGTDAACRLQF